MVFVLFAKMSLNALCPRRDRSMSCFLTGSLNSLIRVQYLPGHPSSRDPGFAPLVAPPGTKGSAFSPAGVAEGTATGPTRVNPKSLKSVDPQPGSSQKPFLFPPLHLVVQFWVFLKAGCQGKPGPSNKWLFVSPTVQVVTNTCLVEARHLSSGFQTLEDQEFQVEMDGFLLQSAKFRHANPVSVRVRARLGGKPQTRLLSGSLGNWIWFLL